MFSISPRLGVFIEILNAHTMNCFMEVGGYPTWTHVYNIIQPILAEANRDDVEDLLLEAENDFQSTKTKQSDYFQVVEAHSQLFQSIRRWNIGRTIRA